MIDNSFPPPAGYGAVMQRADEQQCDAWKLPETVPGQHGGDDTVNFYHAHDPAFHLNGTTTATAVDMTESDRGMTPNGAPCYLHEKTKNGVAPGTKPDTSGGGGGGKPGNPPPSLDIRPPSPIEISADVTLKTYLSSIIRMPRCLWVLCLVNLFCWMSLVCYSLYFTDFVGQAVFMGDPQAPPGSRAHNDYDDGVRLGSFGMSLYSLSCSVYSLLIEKLVRRYREFGLVDVLLVVVVVVVVVIVAFWGERL